MKDLRERVFEKTLPTHEKLVERYGGAKGVRDVSALDAALNRPFATFGGQDLYVKATQKAAAILESIVVNHSFIDGNKRTCYALARIILLESGFVLREDSEEKIDMVLAVAQGKMDTEEITEWLEKRAEKI